MGVLDSSSPYQKPQNIGFEPHSEQTIRGFTKSALETQSPGDKPSTELQGDPHNPLPSHLCGWLLTTESVLPLYFF